MPKVIFLPMNVTVEAKDGESILNIALENDIYLEHNCGGFCACSTCHVIVHKGMEVLPEATEEEEDQLDEAEGLTVNSRLGCQCLVAGDVVVEIPPHSRNAPGNIGGHHH